MPPKAKDKAGREARAVTASLMPQGALTTGVPHSRCGVCRTGVSCFCHALPGLDVARLLRPAIVHLPVGTEFLRLGDAAPDVQVVLDGWVLIYALLGDGRRQVLKFAMRGDLLALGVNPAALPYAAQALTEVALCVVARSRLMDACRIHPGLGLDLLDVVSRDCVLAYEHLTSVGRCTARERIARLLLEIYRRARTAYPETDVPTIPLPLTQTHIGDALGLTAVHTNRMLSSLRDDGIISLAKRTLCVLDGQRLAAAAGLVG